MNINYVIWLFVLLFRSSSLFLFALLQSLFFNIPRFFFLRSLVAILHIEALLVQRSPEFLPCFFIISFFYCFSSSDLSLLSLYPLGNSDLTTNLAPNLTINLTSHHPLLYPLNPPLTYFSYVTHLLNSTVPCPPPSPLLNLSIRMSWCLPGIDDIN